MKLNVSNFYFYKITVKIFQFKRSKQANVNESVFDQPDAHGDVATFILNQSIKSINHLFSVVGTLS